MDLGKGAGLLSDLLNWMQGGKGQWTESLSLKPGLHLNANANASAACKNDANIWYRCEHLAMRQTFDKQPHANCQLSVLQREFAYYTFTYRRTWFIFYVWRCCKLVRTDERTAWEQGLSVASVNTEQCTNVLAPYTIQTKHSPFKQR